MLRSAGSIVHPDTPWGCGQKLGLVLRHNAKTVSIFDWASSAKRYLDPFLVVPPNVAINFIDKLLECGVLPIAGIKELCFQPSEEAFARSVIWGARLAGH